MRILFHKSWKLFGLGLCWNREYKSLEIRFLCSVLWILGSKSHKWVSKIEPLLKENGWKILA